MTRRNRVNVPTAGQTLSCVQLRIIMAYSGRPLPAHLRHASTTSGSQSASGQSPFLIAKINEKKAELANLKELQALSAGLADQMQMLEDKLSTLTNGTEGTMTLSRRCDVMKGS